MYSTMHSFPLTITAILRHASRVHGARKVTTATGDGYREHTYAEIGQHAAQLANALRRIGVTGDQRVATFMWNNAEHLAAYLAVPSMGAVLHTLNIRLFPEQIVYVANEAEDQVVLVDMSLAKLLAPILADLETVHTVIAVGDGDTAALEESGKTVLRYADVIAGESDRVRLAGDRRKLRGRNVLHQRHHRQPQRRRLQPSFELSAHHGDLYRQRHRDQLQRLRAADRADVSRQRLGSAVCGADGGRRPGAARLPSGRQVAGRHDREAASHRRRRGADHLERRHALPREEPGHDVSSLRIVPCGGSAVPVSLMRTFEERHGVQIRQLWGMTETSPMATMAWPPPGTPEDQHWAFRATQGQPLCGVEARIVDDDGQVLPNDNEAVGEVEVRGPWITSSYYRGHDESKFDSGWLRTGDVGRIDEHGFITLTDRAKDVIKSGGEWISSVELENCLFAHPDVIEAAVVAVPDERWQERPLAVVVAREGSDIKADDLRKFLADKVVRWWLPERWTFVDEIPRTSVGKYDKKTIRSRYADDVYEVIEARD